MWPQPIAAAGSRISRESERVPCRRQDTRDLGSVSAIRLSALNQHRSTGPPTRPPGTSVCAQHTQYSSGKHRVAVSSPQPAPSSPTPPRGQYIMAVNKLLRQCGHLWELAKGKKRTRASLLCMTLLLRKGFLRGLHCIGSGEPHRTAIKKKKKHANCSILMNET